MAANDLTNELLSPSMEPTLTDNVSYKVVEAVLNLLQDKNGEVQNMGVKWFLLCPSGFLIFQSICVGAKIERATSSDYH